MKKEIGTNVNITIKPSIISSVMLLLLGLLLFFESDTTIISISYVIGSVLVLLGCFALVNFFKRGSSDLLFELNIIYGIVSIILGVLIIKNPTFIGSIIPFLIGIGILINSASKLKMSFILKKLNSNKWLYTMIISIITSICGILLIFNPFKASSIFIQIIGGCIVVYAILDIISSIFIRKESFKKDKNKKDKKIKDAEVIEEKEE